jgi:glucoamylase
VLYQLSYLARAQELARSGKASGRTGIEADCIEGVTRTRAGLALVAAAAVAVAVLSGGSSADPRTPAGLPGLPPPFLGTAVVGGGGLTAAVDAYGDVVDLRAPGPAGRALIDNPTDRQAAGSVAADTGIVPRVDAGGEERPLWRADRVRQRYRPGTNVVVTEAWFGDARVEVAYAAAGEELACLTRVRRAASAGGETAGGPSPTASTTAERRVHFGSEEATARSRLRCDTSQAQRIVRRAVRADRRWLTQARALGPAAPSWAQRMYERSLLILRVLTDRRTGAVAAGARDGWAYVWPRDAATAALAFAAAGYRDEAERVSSFLLGLGLDAAARYRGNGAPVPGRAAQGDATGWVAAAAQAAGSIGSAKHAARILSSAYPVPWRGLSDYQEGDSGDYLANAIASGAPLGEFLTERGLVRRSGDRDSGFDAAAAWAVRPFPRPRFFPAAGRTLRRLAAAGGRFGIVPGESWPGTDPWTAPTAWSAWSLAALASEAGGRPAGRRAALRLLAALRRAATPAGALPERVDARTGVPVSTTPLAWSHAFAILALRELWPTNP